ncbi:MAG: hypothetical protein ACPGTP_09150, partial [Bacteroidia bacterium]
KGMRPFEYKVLHVTEGGVSEIDVKLTGSNKVSDLALFIDNTDQLYLCGFYGKDIKSGENTAIDGVFFGEINMKSKSISVKTHKFKNDLLEDLIDEKDLKKGYGDSYEYGIKELISFDDGTFSFLAENTYWDALKKEYHSDGMIIPKFNKDGSLIHIAKIDKQFSSKLREETSYTSNVYNGKIYIVSNDEKSKEEKAELHKAGMKKGGKFTRFTDLCIIGADGKIEEQKTIFNDQEPGSFYAPIYSFHHKDKLVLATVTTMFKKYKYGTMQLK